MMLSGNAGAPTNTMEGPLLTSSGHSANSEFSEREVSSHQALVLILITLFFSIAARNKHAQGETWSQLHLRGGSRNQLHGNEESDEDEPLDTLWCL